jgi:hypothetical protein
MGREVAILRRIPVLISATPNRHDLLRAAGRNRRFQFREPSFQRHLSIASSSFRTRSSSSAVSMILANACTIFVSSPASAVVALPNSFDNGTHSRNRVVERFDLRQDKRHGAVFARRQDTIQAETQSRDIAGQGNIDRLLSEGSRLAVKESLKGDRGGIAGAIRPAARVAGLPFLKWPPSLFSRCTFSRHQTSTPSGQ